MLHCFLAVDYYDLEVYNLNQQSPYIAIFKFSSYVQLPNNPILMYSLYRRTCQFHYIKFSRILSPRHFHYMKCSRFENLHIQGIMPDLFA